MFVDDAGKKNEDVGTLAKDGLGYLEKRADFWRQQLPPPSRNKNNTQKVKKGKKTTSSANAEKDPQKYIITQMDMIDKGRP